MPDQTFAAIVSAPNGCGSTGAPTDPDELLTRFAALERHGVEIVRIEDESQLRSTYDGLGRHGIGPALILVVRSADRDVLEVLDEQLARHDEHRVPAIDPDPRWVVTADGDPSTHRAHDAVLTIADGRFGSRGAGAPLDPAREPMVIAGGVYAGATNPRLLEGPLWAGLETREPPRRSLSSLDLRTGVLSRELSTGGGTVRTCCFASLARPGCMAMRAEGPPGELRPGPPLRPPRHPHEHSSVDAGSHDDVGWSASAAEDGGGIVAAATQRARRGRGGTVETLERVAAYRGDPWRVPSLDEVETALADVERVGFDQLLREQRATWASRWEDGCITIDGDPETELGVRFALFHLLASAPSAGEAAVGARGLSGPAYAGHVFWDTDVFVLPALAAVCPDAARAVLEYRVRRLGAARTNAAARGLAGARFPWESARDGDDVTPSSGVDPEGNVVAIRTGALEEHIVADVAWAANHYAEWTGDTDFIAGPGRALITETARYWASRVHVDEAGRAHLLGVIGPDEYHELVDDNAYTNVMARWNLRCAARLLSDGDGDGDGAATEAAHWRDLAGALVDGYDPVTGRHEQFAGFDALEPLLISEVAEPPVAADLLLGYDRVHSAQVVKQADVLMLHHLVPDEVTAGSLTADLDHYLPRTAHGSSLSPAIHASLLARAGRPDEALDLLRVACRLDLDDLTGMAGGGLHLGTMGGVWQAVVFGVAGVRVRDGVLRVDPQLPAAWDGLTVNLRVQRCRVRIRLEPDLVQVDTDHPLPLAIGGGEPTVITGRTRVDRRAGRWKDTT